MVKKRKRRVKQTPPKDSASALPISVFLVTILMIGAFFILNPGIPTGD